MIYKPQIDNQNFVYPNFDLAEYDVDIIHTPNNNSVLGTVTSISATTVSSSSITITWSGTWSLNGAEPLQVNAKVNTGNTRTYSLHVMGPNQIYYKPWRMVTAAATTFGATNVTYTNTTVTFIPTYLGLTTFTTGTYYFEFRFIGDYCQIDLLSKSFFLYITVYCIFIVVFYRV
jgi:hypothetical protein